MKPKHSQASFPPGVSLRNQGEGRLGPLIWSKDWSETSVGPVASWPATLLGYVRMILALPTPAIIFWGPDQVQLYNDGYSVIMGPRHPRHLGSTYRECWPDTYPTLHPWMQQVLRGEVVQVERTLIPVTRYGFDEEAYFTFTFSPLRDDRGEIGGILQLVTEETDSVLADRRAQTLRELASPSEAFRSRGGVLEPLRSNPADVPFALFFHANDGSDALELDSAVGLEPSQLQGTTIEALKTLTRKAMTNGAPMDLERWESFGLQPANVSGTPPVGTARILPVRRGAGEVVGALILGASARLRMDDRYREFFGRIAHELGTRLVIHQERLLTEQLKLTLDSAKMGTWHVDLRARRIRFSRRTAEFLGGDQPIETDFAELTDARLHPEDRGRIDEAWQRALADGSLYQIEYRICRDDGSVRWLSSWGRAAYDQHGVPLSFSGVSVDVTERKEDEARLHEAVRARDEFISIASHELKTPLASLQLTTQGMKRALAREHPEAFSPARVHKLLNQTERQGERLSRLVHDMLDVARINTGKLELRRESTELGALVTDVADRLRAHFEAARTELQLDCPTPVRAEVDRDRIEQVIVNLLSNALRYGKGTPVRVSVRAVGERAEVSVEDRGPGIAPGDQARIFERFERAISANEVSGLGLGLFISRQIVEAHGGHIRVESALNSGARFAFDLPLSP